jgi:hypothetical protein
MSNKTDFCCDSLPNAIELPRRGEGEKKFHFSPLCALLTGHVKLEYSSRLATEGESILFFQFSMISSPFYLHSVGADNKIVACSGPLPHLWGEDYCKKSLFCVFVCHKCAAFQSKACTHKIIYFLLFS